MAMTMLFSTMTSAILASVWGICVYAAGQLSHNVLSLSPPRTLRGRSRHVAGRVLPGPQPERGRHPRRGGRRGRGLLDQPRRRGASTCSPTSSSPWSSPPGSSGARSSDVRLLRRIVVVALVVALRRRRDRLPVEPARRGEARTRSSSCRRRASTGTSRPACGRRWPTCTGSTRSSTTASISSPTTGSTRCPRWCASSPPLSPHFTEAVLLRRLRHDRRRPARRRLRDAPAGVQGQPRRLALSVLPRVLRLHLRVGQRTRTESPPSGTRTPRGCPARPRSCRAWRPSSPRAAAPEQTAIDLWTQVYCQGDKYAQQKAVAALDQLLPKDKVAREKAVAALQGTVPPAMFDAVRRRPVPGLPVRGRGAPAPGGLEC